MRRATIPTTAFVLLALPASAEAPAIVTDTPVVHSLVAQVIGDLGSPTLLLDQGADAHDFQLRPSQLRSIQAADLVIWTGPTLMPRLSGALGGTDGTPAIALLDAEGTLLRHYGTAEHDEDDDHGDHDATEAHDHDDAHVEGGTHDDDHAGHDHGTGLDPHAWLDPDNAEIWIGLISDALVERDPGNAVAYRANASLALTRIETLEAAITRDLADAGAAPIIVAHDAYGYFADHFGLRIVAAVADGDAADPGAAHLSRVRALLESGEVTCIFPEVIRDPSPVIAVADGTGARIGGALDPEGRAIAPGPLLYDQLLQNMGATIAECLAGG